MKTIILLASSSWKLIFDSNMCVRTPICLSLLLVAFGCKVPSSYRQPTSSQKCSDKPNTELPQVVQKAVVELKAGVQSAQDGLKRAKETAALEDQKAKTARQTLLKAEQAKAQALKDLDKAQRERDEAIEDKRRIEEAIVDPGIGNREFLFFAMSELKRLRMEVRSFDAGRSTSHFLAFSPGSHRLTVGKDVDTSTLYKQLRAVRDTVKRLQADNRSVRGFKVISAPHHGNVLFGESLTIYWPKQPVQAPSESSGK